MSIPIPEPGLVINYAYLWHTEHEAGREEGRKNRPSVVVLTVERDSDGATVVVVLPVTHSLTAPRCGRRRGDPCCRQAAART